VARDNAFTGAMEPRVAGEHTVCGVSVTPRPDLEGRCGARTVPHAAARRSPLHGWGPMAHGRAYGATMTTTTELLETLTVAQVREIAALAAGLTAQHATQPHPYTPIVGRNVIVRSNLSGVWWGRLVRVSGATAVSLEGARRIWYWASGAGSCSALALRGCDAAGSKIEGPVSVTISETIEIVTTTPEADAVLASLPVWLP
jgi:hypothetical protein